MESNLQKLTGRIEAAALRCGRDPGQIQLLAVSKTFPVSSIEAVFSAGQRLFGENRIQEAQKKIPELAGRGIEWHLIGHLQSNKVRPAVELFDVIQTLDSAKLARRVDRVAAEMGKVQRVYVQVNLGRETQKHGIAPEDLTGMVALVDSLPALKLLGLMAIPPYERDPELCRPYFGELAELRDRLNQARPVPLPGLSMGMSHDFEVAIEEGSTLLRVGTAIFGPRSSAP